MEKDALYYNDLIYAIKEYAGMLEEENQETKIGLKKDQYVLNLLMLKKECLIFKFQNFFKIYIK